MAKKIIILLASPHADGNTSKVAHWISDGAQACGADVETIDLTKLYYKTGGCIACMACHRSDEFRCVIDDDASPLLARLPEADVLLFATPVYWGGPTAQLKRFMDRMFSLTKFSDDGEMAHALKSTRFALLATAGGDLEDGLSLTEKVFEFATVACAGDLISLLVPNAHDTDDDDLSDKAADFGRKLAEI